MSVIEPGRPAPDFELADQHRTTHRLSAYQGKAVVLLFYPKDFSSVCTEEMACVVNAMARFNELDAHLFGISIDHTDAHRVFAQQMGIEYPLLADFHPRGEASDRFGFYRPEFGITTRGYVVVDAEGTVAAAKETGFRTIPDMDEIAAILESLA